MEPLAEAVERLRPARRLDLHLAAGEVPHPARHPELARRLADEVAEAHALHAAGEEPADGAGARRHSAFQPWRPRSGTKATSSPSRRRSSPRADFL
jgi:hypothetical protein